MTLALKKISTQNAQAMIANEYGGNFGDMSLRRSLAADHIRSTLFAHAALAVKHGFFPAVHTSRLLTPVRKTFDLLWTNTASENDRDAKKTKNVAQETLDTLKDFGDIVGTGGGYWVGTPLRIVRSNNILLAVGAAPNVVVKSCFGASPICTSIARFSASSSKKLAERAISVSEFLGNVKDITSWTKETLQQHEQRMQSGNDIPADQLEIFAPDLLNRTQLNPWISAGAVNHSISGARLCRPIKTVAFVWDRPYYLSHFRLSAGTLVVARSVRVEYDFTRRLRFGLRNLYGSHQIVAGVASGELVELEMPIPLPEAEGRIAALGWPSPSNPRRTIFHRLAIPFVTEVMARLSVSVTVR